jgi:hypothetical protein
MKKSKETISINDLTKNDIKEIEEEIFKKKKIPTLKMREININPNQELEALDTALKKWCDYLAKENYENFSEMFQSAFRKLKMAFTKDQGRFEALLDFQDSFRGGMGSINDISIDDSALRKAVEKERDLLIKKYQQTRTL